MISYTDYYINKENINKDSIVVLFKKENEKIINKNIIDTMIEDAPAFKDYLKFNNHISYINPILSISDSNNGMHYIILFYKDEIMFKEFERTIVKVRLNCLSIMHKYRCKNLYTYDIFGNNERFRSIFLKYIADMDIDVNFCLFH